MKLISTITLLFFSAQLFACPSFGGNYICKISSGELSDFKINISQTEKKITYTLIAENMPITFITDGQERKLKKLTKNSSGVNNIKYKASCRGSILNIAVKADVDFEGTGDFVAAELGFDQSYNREGFLSIVSRISADYNVLYTGETVCTKE